MKTLLVTVSKLNRRSHVPVAFPDKTGINGIVLKGFRFEGTEVSPVPNPALGKWYQDNAGYYYWGGGLIVESEAPPPAAAISTSITGLPANLPDGYRLCIDVSHHNGTPDWAAIQAAGITHCYIKISEGVGTRDKLAATHTANARQYGLKTGYYHFCRPDTRNGGTVDSDAQAEAREAAGIIGGLDAPDLPLVLDLEDQQGWDTPLGPDNYLRWIQAFIRETDAAGIPTMIYSRKEYLDRRLPAKHGLGNQKLWLANYTQQDCLKVACPAGWDRWAMWQFTESGRIGHSAALDISIIKSSELL